MSPPASSSFDPNSLKLAIAIALLRSKKFHQSSSTSAASLDPDAQRWKRKAKERKREIMKLREEIKQLEDGMGCEDLPQIASCRCHFFDGCGGLERNGAGGGSEHWIDEVLRRRFLRLVRWKERRKKLHGSIRRRHLMEFIGEDDIQLLGTSIDFLVELSDTFLVGTDSSLATFSHQAIDLILGGSLDSRSDAQFYVQHLLRKLGNEPFIGQRIMLSISQKICITAESLLFIDPFDNAFPGMHDSVFMMIQLLEFLVSDNMQSWVNNEEFDRRLFEEWVRSVVQARKDLEILECRNGLYMICMERVFGELMKQVGPLACQGKLEMEILSSLLYQ